MKAFIKKYWLALVLFGLFILGLIFVFSRNTGTTPAPTPTPLTFEVTNTYPSEGAHEIALDNYALEFLFSKEVDLSKTAIKASPNTDINISYGDTKKSIIVRPEEKWQKDTSYIFTISAFSVDGDSLKNPFEYNITFKTITSSGFEENFSY